MTKKQTYIGIAIIVLIFGFISVKNIIKRVNEGDVVRGEVAAIDKGDNSAESGELSYITINGKDRKVPEFKLIDQNNDTITDKSYRGKVFLVEFFFTRCPDICIPMSKNLIEIQNEFADREDFGIASISIDPEYDTPEVLKKYAAAYGAVHPNWHYLTGDRETIYDLSNIGFNINAQANPNLEASFTHSGLFALVDQNGFIRSRLDDFGNPLVYYRGNIPRGEVKDGQEDPQIDILITDIKKLLKQD